MLHSDSLDFDKMVIEKGDEHIVPFSFETTEVGENKVDCYLVYTNEETHRIIRENLHRSAMYSGLVEGVGPR